MFQFNIYLKIVHTFASHNLTDNSEQYYKHQKIKNDNIALFQILAASLSRRFRNHQQKNSRLFRILSNLNCFRKQAL